MLETLPKSDPSAGISITQASSAQHYDDARNLMIEFRDNELSDDISYCGGGLNDELKSLPNPYCPPKGVFLLAYYLGKPCGCLALRPLTESSGEITRMYVKPAARGKGIAEHLLRNIIEIGRTYGYSALYLDSLKRLQPAHRLYEKLGFNYCDPYVENPAPELLSNAIFMKLELS